MRPHLIVKLHVPASGHVVHWQEAIDDKSGVHRGLQTDVDAVLARHGLDVWVTREHRPAGSSFSAPEIAAGLDRIYRLILASGAGFPQPLVDELATLPAVEYVRGVRIGATPLPSYAEERGLAARTGVAAREAIGLPDAHLHGRGDPSVTVAVLDTGVDLEHPELVDALEPGEDFVDVIDGAGRFVGDFLDADAVPADEVGHGTHVAGVIAARGLKMPAGVAPECRVLPVRVLGALERDGQRYGAGLVDDINAGFKWAVDKGAAVVNLSLGIEATGRDLPHADVVDYARRKGVTVVAASGNDGSATTRFFPAAIPYVVTVGATDTTGAVATFSTFGAPVDLVAPGTDIYSSYLEKGYAFSSGTSHAAPFVAGSAALLHALARRHGARLRDSQLKYLLRQTADRPGTRFRDRRAGFGQLNVADAARLLLHKMNGRR